MSTNQVVLSTIPYGPYQVPSKVKRSDQRTGESFSQWQERMREQRMNAMQRKRLSRERTKGRIASLAIDALQAHGAAVKAMSDGARYHGDIAPTLEDKTRSYFGLTTGLSSMRPARDDYKGAEMSNLDAVLSVLPTRLLGTRQAVDIVASLTGKFKGFSRSNRRSSFMSEVFLAYQRKNEVAYADMVRKSQASKCNVFSLIRPSEVYGSVHYFPRFVPSGLEIYTQTERLTPKGNAPLRASDGVILSPYVNTARHGLKHGGIYPESVSQELATTRAIRSYNWNVTPIQADAPVVPTRKPVILRAIDWTAYNALGAFKVFYTPEAFLIRSSPR